jgi:hypothetical protein
MGAATAGGGGTCGGTEGGTVPPCNPPERAQLAMSSGAKTRHPPRAAWRRGGSSGHPLENGRRSTLLERIRRQHSPHVFDPTSLSVRAERNDPVHGRRTARGAR